MSIRTCSKHDIVASKRCPVCAKPLCIHCDMKDGCCSERCFQSRQKFGKVAGKVVRPSNSGGLIKSLLGLAVVLGAAYGAARYFGIELPF